MKRNATKNLMVAGARDYLKASAAIAAFGDHVFATASKLVVKRAKELQRATGVEFNTARMRTHQKDGYIATHQDGTYTWIGSELALPNYNFFYLCVWWGISDRATGQEELLAIVSVVCRNQKRSADLCQAIQNVDDSSVNLVDGEVRLEKKLKPEDFETLEKHLDLRVSEWIKRVKAIGGLKKHLL